MTIQLSKTSTVINSLHLKSSYYQHDTSLQQSVMTPINITIIWVTQQNHLNFEIFTLKSQNQITVSGKCYHTANWNTFKTVELIWNLIYNSECFQNSFSPLLLIIDLNILRFHFCINASLFFYPSFWQLNE